MCAVVHSKLLRILRHSAFCEAKVYFDSNELMDSDTKIRKGSFLRASILAL